METNKATTTVEALMAGINDNAYKLIQAYAEKSDNPRVEYSKNGKQLFHYSGEMLHVYEDVTYQHVKVVFGLGDSNPDPEPSGFNILGSTMTQIGLSEVLDCLEVKQYENLLGEYIDEVYNPKFSFVYGDVRSAIINSFINDIDDENRGVSMITEAVDNGKRVRYISVWHKDSQQYFVYEYKNLYPRYYEDLAKIDPEDAESSYYPILVTVNSFEDDFSYLLNHAAKQVWYYESPRELLKPEHLSID